LSSCEINAACFGPRSDKSDSTDLEMNLKN